MYLLSIKGLWKKKGNHLSATKINTFCGKFLLLSVLTVIQTPYSRINYKSKGCGFKLPTLCLILVLKLHDFKNLVELPNCIVTVYLEIRRFDSLAIKFPLAKLMVSHVYRILL